MYMYVFLQTSKGTVGVRLPGVITWPCLSIMEVMNHLAVGSIHRTGMAPFDCGRFQLFLP